MSILSLLPVSSLAIRRPALAAAAALVATITSSSPAMAQPPSLGTVMQSCSMSARLLTITLVDSLTAQPIDHATVRFLRKSNGVLLHTGSRITKQPGQWVFLEDGEVPRDEARGGLVGVLVVEREGRPVARRELTIGLDAKGCHLEFRGAQQLRL